MAQRLGDLVEQFIETTLNASSALTALIGANNVWPVAAPLGQVLPAVIYQQWPSASDNANIIATGNRIVGATFYYRVWAADKSASKDTAVLIARAIHDALHGAKGLVGNPAVNVSNAQEQAEYTAPYLDQGTWYQQEGSYFRFWIDGN